MIRTIVCKLDDVRLQKRCRGGISINWISIMVLSPNLLSLGWKKEIIIGKLKAFFTSMKHVKCHVDFHRSWYISNMNAIKINQANVGKFITSYHGPCGIKTLGFHPSINGPIFFECLKSLDSPQETWNSFCVRQNKRVSHPKPRSKCQKFRKNMLLDPKTYLPTSHPRKRKISFNSTFGGFLLTQEGE